MPHFGQKAEPSVTASPQPGQETAAEIGVPQLSQNLELSGSSLPHLGQGIMVVSSFMFLPPAAETVSPPAGHLLDCLAFREPFFYMHSSLERMTEAAVSERLVRIAAYAETQTLRTTAGESAEIQYRSIYKYNMDNADYQGKS